MYSKHINLCKWKELLLLSVNFGTISLLASTIKVEDTSQ